MNPTPKPPQNEETYSMRAVARATGLTPDTIRAWERRYAAITPQRTSGNTRRYSSSDVRRLSLLREATQRGHTISAIAHLPEGPLSQLIARDSPPQNPTLAGAPLPKLPAPSQENPFIHNYLSLILRFDARQANDMLIKAATLMDPYDFLFSIVIPTIEQIGEHWSHAEIGAAQEHLVSSQLRAILSSMLRSPPHHHLPKPPRILISTPQHQRHEFGIMIGAFLAASSGFDVIYLGPDLPDHELVWACGISHTDILLLGLAQDSDPEEAPKLGQTLDMLAQRIDVWIGTPANHNLIQQTRHVRYFHRFEDLQAALSAYKQP